MNYEHLIGAQFSSCVQRSTWGVLRAQSDILNGAFCENSQRLKYFDILQIKQAGEGSLMGMDNSITKRD